MVELRPMVGLISAGAEINPLLPGSVYAPQAVVKTGLDLRPISTETYIKLREVLIVAVYVRTTCNFPLSVLLC